MSAQSRNGIAIRLSDERWAHIVEGHPEMAGLRDSLLEAVSGPSRLLRGSHDELLAVREIEPGKWLVAIYRELEQDGFIITAFLTRREGWLEGKEQVWP